MADMGAGTNSRYIIGLGSAAIPASGQIAKHSVEKYIKCRNRSGAMRKSVLKSVAKMVLPTASITANEKLT